MRIIATDLDRTLIPNGTIPDTDSVSNFTSKIRECNYGLIYVTARNIDSVEEAIARYNLPLPEIVIGQVGSSMHKFEDNQFVEMHSWRRHIQSDSPLWDFAKLNSALSDLPFLKIQDECELNPFKLSYTVHDLQLFDTIVPRVTEIVQRTLSDNAEVTASKDLNANCSYIDIMPSAVSKYKALEFYRLRNNLQREQFLFAGDSENDLSILQSDYSVVVVNNAHDSLKECVVKQKIGSAPIVASGRFDSDGNYGNGIVEAIEVLGW